MPRPPKPVAGAASTARVPDLPSLPVTLPLVAGVDVGKRWLDVALSPTGPVARFANDATGIAQLLTQLADAGVTAVVCEATGGYERAMAAACTAAGMPVAIVNPRQVRSFARSTGVLAKTDALDARLLARYGALLSPAPTALPDAAARELRALVAVRRDLVQARVRLQQQAAVADPVAVPLLSPVIALLTTHLRDADAAIAAALAARPDWAVRAALLASVPGVGPVTVAVLIAELPELGHTDHRHLAALAGLAPRNHDSGQHRGQRHIWGGRATVRHALYLAALSAMQHNPVLRAFRTRLLIGTRPKKVAVIACAHKLLTILNAMVRTQTPWCPPPPVAAPA